ncbi:hypothetical protein [Pseudomonas proteolytica]|uniref:hypothetical protein n=1 Tax=Pseudomonas proteolytica TaxID=219574 RepID=UPI0014734382|nr:hypothetical protein [Pseudomonas proteolytica]NMZ34068.1 hypothetical protein [Pseudomonas proteolytica]
MSDKNHSVTYKVAGMGADYIYQQDKAGNKAGDTHQSLAGHMWYSVSDGTTKNSYGFTSAFEQMSGEGAVSAFDDAAYQKTIYEVTIQLTEAQYSNLISFSKNPELAGFDASTYNVLTNSCVDFVYSSLKTIGYNEKEFEGSLLPAANIVPIKNLLDSFGAQIIRDDLTRRGDYYNSDELQMCLWLDERDVSSNLSDTGLRNERIAERDFIAQMQKEINEFNFSLSDLVKPGNGFLYQDYNGITSWNGGVAAFQEHVFENNGLDIFNGGYSWQSNFNQKMDRINSAEKSMQEFINSDFGKADKALGGKAAEVSKKTEEKKADMQEAFGEFTPLVLDLSGDGIKTRSIFDKIKGFEFVPGEKNAYHGWLDRESGFLAFDENDNGIIDNGRELFGSASEDGFTLLSRLDSNLDGRIDAADDFFDKLRVWQDKNQNTISEAGELMSLQEAKIRSISLEDVEATYRPDKNGNTIKWVSDYMLESGETREIADVYFTYSKPTSAIANKMASDPFALSLEQQTQSFVDTIATVKSAPRIEVIRAPNTVEQHNVPMVAMVGQPELPTDF